MNLTKPSGEINNYLSDIHEDEVWKEGIDFLGSLPFVTWERASLQTWV
jgi:hypothetical protein